MAKSKQVSSTQLERIKKIAVKLPPRADKDIQTNDRITFTGQFYHHSWGEQPTTIPIRCQRLLRHKIQPVPRRVVISARDTEIDTQWIKDLSQVGYLIIENRTGAGMLQNPTLEEKEKLEEQILLVRFKGAKKGCKVRPGMYFIAEPEDISELILRAADEPVNINYWILPS